MKDWSVEEDEAEAQLEKTLEEEKDVVELMLGD